LLLIGLCLCARLRLALRELGVGKRCAFAEFGRTLQRCADIAGPHSLKIRITPGCAWSRIWLSRWSKRRGGSCLAAHHDRADSNDHDDGRELSVQWF
jgi:hypothetical protein